MAVQFSSVQMAGAPTNGVNAVKTLTITGTPTGGTFTLTFGGQTTAAIAYNATAAQVQAALELLSSIGTGGVVCAGGPLPGTGVTITFALTLAGKPQNTPTSTDSLTGGSAPASALANTTTGVWGSYRSVPLGCYLLDTTNGFLYRNTGDIYTPVWTKQ